MPVNEIIRVESNYTVDAKTGHNVIHELKFDLLNNN